MGEILRHYTDKPIGKIRSEFQEVVDVYSVYVKPSGFWVSVVGGDDWASWCRSESFRDTDKQIAYDIAIAPHANILRLRCHGDLLSFQQHFGRPGKFGRFAIDWAAVAENHQGIIIAPYVWSARLDLSWYYVWDCASGCIWDAAAIERLEPVTSSIGVAACAS